MVMGNPAAGYQPNSKMALLPLSEGVSVQTLTVFIALAALLLNAVAWIAQRQQVTACSQSACSSSHRAYAACS